MKEHHVGLRNNARYKISDLVRVTLERETDRLSLQRISSHNAVSDSRTRIVDNTHNVTLVDL